MSTLHETTRHHKRAHHTATALGWLSLGLGLTELLAAGPLARLLGVPAAHGLIRACGVRELAAGVGLLTGGDPRPWLYGRVAGDALDLAGLGWAARHGERPLNALLATGAVAGVTALDLGCVRGLRAERVPLPTWDYSDRSGFPDVAESMRGLVEPAFATERAHPNGWRGTLSQTRH